MSDKTMLAVIEVFVGETRPSENLPEWEGLFPALVFEERIARHIRCAPKHWPLPFIPKSYGLPWARKGPK